MDDTPAVKQLKGHLTALPPGEVAVPGPLIALLAGCWHELDGGAAEGMKTSKLARMEDVRWEPPILSFQLERHGALALGSTRAELQVWSVDLDDNRVSCAKSRSYRQLVPRAERVRVEPIASEIAEAITAGRDDHRLKWGRDGTVRVVQTKVFPLGVRVYADYRRTPKKTPRDPDATPGGARLARNPQGRVLERGRGVDGLRGKKRDWSEETAAVTVLLRGFRNLSGETRFA